MTNGVLGLDRANPTMFHDCQLDGRDTGAGDLIVWVEPVPRLPGSDGGIRHTAALILVSSAPLWHWWARGAPPPDGFLPGTTLTALNHPCPLHQFLYPLPIRNPVRVTELLERRRNPYRRPRVQRDHGSEPFA